MKFDRVLTILIVLLGGERTSAAELAGRFGVSVRTIYRDLRSLEAAGIPLVTRQGRGGGIDIVDGFTLNRHLLKPEELDRIHGALRGLMRVLPDPATASGTGKFEALYRKRGRSNPERGSKFETGGEEYFYFDMQPWNGSDRNVVPVQRFYDWCRRSMVLQTKYTDGSGTTVDRDIEPMTLVYRGSTWYLYAWCRLRKDFRLFRLTSIERVIPTGERFVRRAGSYEATVKAFEDIGPRTDLVLRFATGIAHIVKARFDQESVTVDGDGRPVVRVAIRNEDIMPFCSSWGKSVEVLEPAWVRAEVAKAAREVLDIYGTGY